MSESLTINEPPTVWVGGTPRVFIACLRCYNDGALIGHWFDAIDADEVTAVSSSIARAFAGSRLAIDTGGKAMMSTQDRNPVFKAVAARMKWVCDDPSTLEACGLRLLESRTFAQPQPDVARTWPPLYRYGLKALGWTPMVSTYKLNLFECTPGSV